MYVRRNVLLKAVVDEVEERVYHSSISEDAAEKGEVEDEIPELQVCGLPAHLLTATTPFSEHYGLRANLQKLGALSRITPTGRTGRDLFG